MTTDPYIFFTESHRLYVQGVRRAIQQRLYEAFGDNWWEEGVERALSSDQVNRLRSEVQHNSSRDRLFALDAAHFGLIVTKHHNQVFSDSFNDSARMYKVFRQLTNLRNDWAHVQEMPSPRARQAAEIMKHILASLQCEEALQIERMEQEFRLSYENQSIDETIDSDNYADEEDEAAGSKAMPITPLELWTQLQSYLILEKSVELPSEEAPDRANVTLKVHNAAPDSNDWPSLRFKSVSVSASGQGQHGIGSLSPGETKEVEFSFHVRQLLSVEFEASGQIDINELSSFRRASNLPSEIITPLQQEFVDQLNSIGIRDFIGNALDDFSAISPDMTLATIAQVRAKLQVQSDDVVAKQDALATLLKEFRLDRDSTLGTRTRDIILALNEFKSKLEALNEAIGRTDIDLIKEAVHELEQVQLAVLRVEGAVRDMTASV